MGFGWEIETTYEGWKGAPKTVESCLGAHFAKVEELGG